MKRIENLFASICSLNNLRAADLKARKGKLHQYGVCLHDKNKVSNLISLHQSLISGNYKTSAYDIFIIHEPKEREIYRLPYFPDRIVHHAIMNIVKPIWVKSFTHDTYSCIEGRGIHRAASKLSQALRGGRGGGDKYKYCLKLDIKKFYPSINHYILKQIIRRKIKDKSLLNLLDEIIDSAPGLPIGNYLSQYLANLYLNQFDHWIKETLKIEQYYRYADDIVILHHDKPHLHNILFQIRGYLNNNLKLTVKENYQIFPIEKRGIDFLGYKFYHTHTLLRKGIKKRFIIMLKRRRNDRSIASYNGWLSHADCVNLKKKSLTNSIINSDEKFQ